MGGIYYTQHSFFKTPLLKAKQPVTTINVIKIYYYILDKSKIGGNFMVRPVDTDVPVKVISWSAIIAGALVALSLSFLIHMFNLGIGLSAFTTNRNGMLALAIGGMLWLLLTGIVTMFMSGWVAGKIASRYTDKPCEGILHGFLSWSLALILALTLATNVATGWITGSQETGNKVQAIAQQAATDTGKAITPSRAGEKTANSAGVTALAGFLVFLFGAIASGVGGYYGVVGSRRRSGFLER